MSQEIQNKNNSRNVSKHTARRLYLSSGNKCSNPHCKNAIAETKTYVGEIAHIHAVEPGGKRYDPNMTVEERNDIANLILLCSICHTKVDGNQSWVDYPANLLKEWKINHENKIKEVFFKDPSRSQIAINKIINKISELDLDENKNNNKKSPFDIQEKLDYNSLQKNRPLIEEYKVYYAKINALYNELDKQGSLKKTLLLRNIKDIYLKKSRNYFNENTKNHQEIIIKNSDKIFEEIENYILDRIENITDNDLFAVSLIMVHAFMECKILEEPKKS